ncbi:metallophosphoesterase family protein [Arthrobacter sp. RAF14]|uniref:metallophosphoesterase family protein n=1 Tax=Arthrobacter sp. RAF14 TaxID=3233051 RepID=UPI003F924F6F
MQSTPIAIAGDWHGNLGWARQVVRSAAEQGVQTILQVGDFGALWPGRGKGRFEARLNYYLQQAGLRLIFIGGNHDNWAELGKLPVGDDGLAPLLSNIKYLPRPGRTIVHGLVVGGLGGAFSIDHQYRTEGKDWWTNEEPTRNELEDLVKGGPLDLLLTHDVPAGINLELTFELPDAITVQANRTRDLLAEAVARTRPSIVFCGHWHQRTTELINTGTKEPTTIEVLDMDGSRDGNAVVLHNDHGSLKAEGLRIVSG